MLLLLPALSYGQAWSGILAPNRAIDWTKAGMTNPIPVTNEGTTNPWTPPSTRTQCGSTLTPSGGNDLTQINSAIAACTPGHYVQLSGTIASPATFTISGNIRLTDGHNGVTLRGGGAGATTLSGGNILVGATSGGGSALIQNVASNFPGGGNMPVGQTSIQVTGSRPPTGLAWITQCDTGFTATSEAYAVPGASATCTGSPNTSFTGIFICGYESCAINGGGISGVPFSQQQYIYIQSVTGSTSPYTVNFTPGLYMLNLSARNFAALAWGDQSYVGFGQGVEDLTIVNGGTLSVNSCYSCWIKGIRLVGTLGNSNPLLTVTRSAHTLIVHNYLFSNDKNLSNTTYAEALSVGGEGRGAGAADTLLLNNIIQQGFYEDFGSTQGDVDAYNYMRDAQTTYPNNGEFAHHAGVSYRLHEGNQEGQSEDDDTDGTHNMNTWFRNHYSCTDPPYTTWTIGANLRGLVMGAFARFENAVGNVLGSNGYCSSTSSPVGHYDGVGFPWIYNTGEAGGTSAGDTAVTTGSFMRWGNWDAVTGHVRHCTANNADAVLGSDASCTADERAHTSGYAPLGLQSPLTASSFPPSFFLPVTTAKPNGGTGLSWWKVCKTWTTFPTSCASYQVQPFPPIGPDVTGGLSDVSGYAYDIPAKVAFDNLPIDASYQVSYNVTSSAWSGGTETLTVSGLPNVMHLMGGFQLSGMPAACTVGANPSNGEILMTGSSATQITYALTENPGVSCTGTFRFPDIRKFDERVYATDSANSGGNNLPSPPTGVAAVVE